MDANLWLCRNSLAPLIVELPQKIRYLVDYKHVAQESINLEQQAVESKINTSNIWN